MVRSSRRARSVALDRLEPRRLLASTLIPIAARDIVFDSQRDVLYMTTSTGGQIQRWDVAQQTLLSPINTGAVGLWGMDITPDGSALIVADAAVQGDFGAVRKIDLQSGDVTTLLYTRDGNEASPWDVAVVSDTRAFVTTRHFFDGAQFNPLRELDLTSGMFTPVTLPGGSAGGRVLQQGNLGRSGDRSKLIISEHWNAGGGKAWLYDTTTDTFLGSRQIGSASLPTANHDGSLVALGPAVYTPDSFLTAPYTNSSSAGLAFDPTRPLIFQGNVQQGVIRVFNHATSLDQGFIPFDQTVGGAVPMGSGITAITDDSQYLYLTVGNGVRQYLITEPPVVSVLNSGVFEGGAIGLVWNGSYGVSTWGWYAWDIDYDGVNFEPEFVNQPPAFSAVGLDGPMQQQVAVRVTNVVGESAIASGTVDVMNVAPTLQLGDNIRIGASRSLKLTGVFADPGADAWSGTVDYGDGTGSHPLAIDPATRTYTLEHTFAATGLYNVTVHLDDGDDTTSDAFIVEAPASDAAGITPAPGATYIVTGSGDAMNLTVTGGSVTFAGGSLNELAIDPGAAMSLPAGGDATLFAGSLSIAAGGTLDLADHDLVVDYSSLSPVGIWTGSTYDGVTGYIQSGRIISSASAGNLKTLAIAEAREALGITGTQTALFAGRAVDSTSVLVKFTWGGDANLDGKINVDDYGRIDGSVAQSGSVFGWFNGDFNYDGKINIDDYGIIDGNINQQDQIL
jgi:hypothetical protein